MKKNAIEVVQYDIVLVITWPEVGVVRSPHSGDDGCEYHDTGIRGIQPRIVVKIESPSVLTMGTSRIMPAAIKANAMLPTPTP